MKQTSDKMIKDKFYSLPIQIFNSISYNLIYNNSFKNCINFIFKGMKKFEEKK